MVPGSGSIAASYNALLNRPTAFPFVTPDVWPKWLHRFKQWHQVYRWVLWHKIESNN